MKHEVIECGDGLWRWRFVGNKDVIAESIKGYNNRDDCVAEMAQVIANILDENT